MADKVKILGIVGSLRKDSYNKAVLEAAKTLVPEDVKLEVFQELGNIPPFNQDLENFPPKAVVYLKEQIRGSDAILFSTPEYNYSFPGILKNAIDWASRPYGDSAWDKKPVAMMTASPGLLGGSRAQYQLRQVFVFLNMFPLNKPEVIISNVNEKVDAQGQISDQHTKEKIAELLRALVIWTKKLEQEKISPEKEEENYPYETYYTRTQQ